MVEALGRGQDAELVPGSIVPSRRPGVPVQVEHRAGLRLAALAGSGTRRARRRRGRRACRPGRRTAGPRRRRPGRARAAAARPSGISVACGESSAPTAMVRAAQLGQRLRRPSDGATMCETRSRSVSRMAMARQRPAGPPLRVEPGERRVPRDVDVAARRARSPAARRCCRT